MSINKSDFVNDAGKNSGTVTCVHCPSKIMTPGTGNFHEAEHKLPKMNQKKNAPEVEVDLITEWFVVDDMFLFENIGVSHSVGDTRYLICADCELGPLGFNDLQSKKCYIALARIKGSS